jgi:hypothetical protein
VNFFCFLSLGEGEASNHLTTTWVKWMVVDWVVNVSFPPPPPPLFLFQVSLCLPYTLLCVPYCLGPHFNLHVCKLAEGWMPLSFCFWIWGQRDAFIRGLPIVPKKMVSSQSMWLLQNKNKNARTHELVNKNEQIYYYNNTHQYCLLLCLPTLIYHQWYRKQILK